MIWLFALIDLIYKSDKFFYYNLYNHVTNKSLIVFRGITFFKQCIDNNIDFYYIDTGYMGCYLTKTGADLQKIFSNIRSFKLQQLIF